MDRSMARALGLLGCAAVVLLRAQSAFAIPEVVVFPLAAQGADPERAASATVVLRETMRGIRDVNAIDTGVVEAQLGVRLTEQAQSCRFDVFCLVEIGELLHSERMLVGHVAKSAKVADAFELKLFVLDVAKSTVIDTLVWTVSTKPGLLEQATRAGARKLFERPDARVRWVLTPENAELRVFGEVLPRDRAGLSSFWSGDYDLVIEAEGYKRLEARVNIPPGGPTTFEFTLDPDLLYVKPTPDSRTTSPFGRSSRREGSGVTAEEVATDAPDAADGSPFANPYAWSATGAGVAATTVGILLASAAQESYNTRADELRFSRDTSSTEVAREARSDAEGRYRFGTLLATGGALLAVGGVTWMLIESALEAPPPPRSRPGVRASATGLEVVW